MAMHYDLKNAIPHREPFLLLDEVLEITPTSVRASATPRPNDELWSRVYAGHYPGQPITPGVLLCEMIFQASAVLAHEILKGENASGVPMVTRIQGVKFKRPVMPGDRLEITAELVERMANAFFMKGRVLREGRAVVEAQFAVALAEPGNDGNPKS